ncbi:MAG TPA: hypothetical protein VM513_10125 [Kofleriaceae bacterium]|nr:hypothetical protein [Kofleriaceae bacterium]
MTLCCMLAGAACGDSKVRPDDAGSGSGSDARPPDGPPPDAQPPDAPPDATVSSAYPARELMSAGGRVTGGSLTVDVQLGHPIEQRAAGSGTKTFEGNAAIKP